MPRKEGCDAVDEEQAEGTPAASAKLNLIDFAHTFGPERMGEEQVRKYQDRFDKGMASLIAEVETAGAGAREAAVASA
ncbi:hypothetical protein ACH4FX_42685 [Streptomyces sp. NPDC018019]|uniref:hypothetical protein n=1 Tax=Streptomyces sp. NPDC018019 TaxID=3365030 RepID=UPI0037917C2D